VFDVLIIDAFSSDAIPTHLLTREALALYRSRLAPDGLIAWHISNKYLDLRPVVEALARDDGLVALVDADLQIPVNAHGRLPSIWVVTTASEKTARAVGSDPRWRPLRTKRPQLWTDDFSNVLGVLR
jgi:spermidine synthase